MSSRKRTISYGEFDHSAELAAGIQERINAALHPVFRDLSREISRAGDGNSWEALDVALVLLDSPQGKLIYKIAKQDDQVGAQYLSQLYATEEGLKYLTGPSGSMLAPHGTLREAYKPGLEKEADLVEQEVKARIATVEKDLKRRGVDWVTARRPEQRGLLASLGLRKNGTRQLKRSLMA